LDRLVEKNDEKKHNFIFTLYYQQVMITYIYLKGLTMATYDSVMSACSNHLHERKNCWR
jgi:hypothetical protein